jgi:hypothetical protein
MIEASNNAKANDFLYPATCAIANFSSYVAANLSSVPNAWTVRIDERTSSAIVAAEEYPAMTRFEAVATIRPPPPIIMTKTGMMHERTKASFHARIYATMRPEKNVPIEHNDKETYNQHIHKELRINLIRDPILNQIDIIGHTICNLSSTNTIEICDILT